MWDEDAHLQEDHVPVQDQIILFRRVLSRCLTGRTRRSARAWLSVSRHSNQHEKQSINHHTDDYPHDEAHAGARGRLIGVLYRTVIVMGGRHARCSGEVARLRVATSGGRQGC